MNASNPDCIEGFGPQHVCNGKKECIGMRDEQDCGKPNCLMVSYLNFHQGFLSLSMDFFRSIFELNLFNKDSETVIPRIPDFYISHESWTMMISSDHDLTF